MNMRIIWKVNLLVFGFFIVSAKPNKSQNDNNENSVENTKPSSRIVNGENSVEGQLPYQISVRASNRHICGGSIISHNYVVTSARCIGSAPASMFEIRAGSTLECSGGVIIKVVETIPHPKYTTDRNDIALLKLSEPLQFNDRIKAIQLANEEVPSGAPVIISGWGATTTGGPISQHLQYIIMVGINFTECKSIITDLPISEICFVPINGNGACGGDTGGPAVYKGRLVGVSNWGINGCGSSYPDGYSSVLHNLKWLRENSDV